MTTIGHQFVPGRQTASVTSTEMLSAFRTEAFKECRFGHIARGVRDRCLGGLLDLRSVDFGLPLAMQDFGHLSVLSLHELH